MQDFLQQENGVRGFRAFRPLPGWQQDSFVPASENRQFSHYKHGNDGSNQTPNNFSYNSTMMKERMKISSLIAALGLLVLSSFSAMAQANQNVGQDGAMSPADADRIIHAFTTKEAEFRRALNSYSFKRDALMQKIGMGGQVTGEYHRVSLFTFDDQGNRYEKISFFPMSTMPEVTTEDVEDVQIKLVYFFFAGVANVVSIDL